MYEMSTIQNPPTEVFSLATCEATISAGLKSFYEVGKALAQIRDAKLYKEKGYGTFESYCKEVWDMSKPRAFELMKAQDTISNLKKSAIADKMPATESQCRPLTKLTPADQQKVWKQVVTECERGNVKVTAKRVEQEVKKFLSPQVKIEAEKSDEQRAQEDAGFTKEDFEESPEAIAGYLEYVFSLVQNKVEDLHESIKDCPYTLKKQHKEVIIKAVVTANQNLIEYLQKD